MNTNELADELEKASTRAEDHGTIAKRNRQAATMLRAQQAEIEALNKQLGRFMKSYNEMAWKLEEVGGAYTHPVKELTDEEITDIWSGMETDTGEQNIAFARAILRKAQEK